MKMTKTKPLLNRGDLSQKTLKHAITFEGVGLHSGSSFRCTLHPAPAHHGVVFLRSDVREKPSIKADVSKVVRTDMCTTLGDGNGNNISTVEHLLSALRGLGIDNVLIEINGAEIPIMDGSALEFARAIQSAGLFDLGVAKKVLVLKQAIGVKHNDKWIYAEPSSKFSISASIEFKHKVIGEQKFQFSHKTDFIKEISGARTFGFLKEVEYLHKKGLALGGSLENAVVLDDDRILNETGLRYKDEFIRHKVLDALGDFSLIGMPILADIKIHKSGHELHTGFISKILSNPQNYQIIEIGSKSSKELGLSESFLMDLAISA